MTDTPVEKRLRVEAEQLLATGEAPTLAALCARRRRKRLVRTTAVVGVLGIMGLAIGFGWRSDSSPSNLSNEGDRTEAGEMVVARKAPAPSVDEPVDELVAESPLVVVLQNGAFRRLGVPIMVRRINDDGQEEFVHGVYIPEHSEPVEWSTLSPWKDPPHNSY